MKRELNRVMDPQFMEINISQLNLNPLSSLSHLEINMDFIFKKQLAIKTLKQDKSNMLMSGLFLLTN
jgi:hypothetical protein